jgi:hypothetical protein
MSGHWICDRCGYDGEHADYCVCLRPAKDQWKGHRTAEEMLALKEVDNPSTLPSTPREMIPPDWKQDQAETTRMAPKGDSKCT